MTLSGEKAVLFIGSGPYRVSQEIRGNIFAHSCLAWLAEREIPVVVLDNDAAGVFARDVAPERIITAPMDRESLAAVIDRVDPSSIWMPCAAKEVQGLVTGILAERGAEDLLPGGARAYLVSSDWAAFRELAGEAGVEVPFGGVAASIEDAARIAGEADFPVFLSASKPRGGGGARIAYNHEELASQMVRMLSWSMTGEVLVVRVHEEHPHCEVILLRDAAGETAVLGIADVLGPLGVHISNSTLVFPGESLPETIAARLTSDAKKLADAAGLSGFGAFHFAMAPDGPSYTVGMAAGFGAASYIASLALGVDLARAATAAAFGEKISNIIAEDAGAARTALSAPRFDSELFPGASGAQGPHKTSTGRGIGLGGSFGEAFLAAERSARCGGVGLFAEVAADAGGAEAPGVVARGGADFVKGSIAALLEGRTIEEVSAATGISRAYLEEMASLVRVYRDLRRCGGPDAPEVAAAMDAGFSRAEAAEALGLESADALPARARPGAAESGGKRTLFVCGPPAHSVGGVDESDVILRGTCRALSARGFRVVFRGWSSQMPLDLFFMADEVLSGDCGAVCAAAGGSPGGSESAASCNAGDLIYCDPRHLRRKFINDEFGAALMNLGSEGGESRGIPGDRKALGRLASQAGLILKEGRQVSDFEQAREAAVSFSYPLFVRPRRRGAADAVVYDEGQLARVVEGCGGAAVVERFLEDIVECAVVVLSDGESARAAAVVEVLEEAGISSVDCAGVLPVFSVGKRTWELVSERAERFVEAAKLKGLATVRIGMRYDVTYLLSASATGSREVPFTAFATGVDIIGKAAAVFDGASLDEVLPRRPAAPAGVFIRQPVFSFDRFPGADTVLGTRARSTGDVVGTGANFTVAFADARRAAGRPLPAGGTVFVSLRDRDKRDGMLLGGELKKAGFKVVATEGTARALAGAGVDARVVYRVSEGRPNVVDLIKNGEISMVIYTPAGRVPREDEVQIRTVAWGLGIPVITTIGEARAAVGAIQAMRGGS